jgi:hypothetical protein
MPGSISMQNHELQDGSVSYANDVARASSPSSSHESVMEVFVMEISRITMMGRLELPEQP